MASGPGARGISPHAGRRLSGYVSGGGGVYEVDADVGDVGDCACCYRRGEIPHLHNLHTGVQPTIHGVGSSGHVSASGAEPGVLEHAGSIRMYRGNPVLVLRLQSERAST